MSSWALAPGQQIFPIAEAMSLSGDSVYPIMAVGLEGVFTFDYKTTLDITPSTSVRMISSPDVPHRALCCSFGPIAECSSDYDGVAFYALSGLLGRYSSADDVLIAGSVLEAGAKAVIKQGEDSIMFGAVDSQLEVTSLSALSTRSLTLSSLSQLQMSLLGYDGSMFTLHSHGDAGSFSLDFTDVINGCTFRTVKDFGNDEHINNIVETGINEYAVGTVSAVYDYAYQSITGGYAQKMSYDDACMWRKLFKHEG